MKSVQKITLAILIAANFCVLSIGQAAVNLVGVGTEGIYEKDSQGALWGVSRTLGRAKKIVKFTGKRGKYTPTTYSSSFVPKLKALGGSNVHNKDGYIDQIWPLPNGSVLFSADVNGKNYLYKLNPKTNSVGNNKPKGNKAGYNNRQAVMNIGQSKGIHHSDIRALHQRSLLIANYKGKPPVLFFGEYNARKGRVIGAAGDAVTLWKSLDMGDTWSKVIAWNTTGHQTDHIYGLKQNPYNGWIYLLFGDDTREAGIVAWDGKSLAPPDNTAIASMKRYKGWKSIAGTASVRTGDITFTKNRCIWMPSLDFLSTQNTSADGFLHSQQANFDLTNQQQGGKVPYQNNIPPILGLTATNGDIYWASYRSKSLAEQKLHVWKSINAGVSWSVTKINIYNTWTSVPTNLLITPWGELAVSGRGILFNKNKNAATGTTAYLTR
ncbi:hypothetical protein [Crenothrix polyspora]|uniref:BNR repeat-containing glycosyl hydrolase n=1 Tax=Crenothrix polyspora TaxID=360316 RepID=A0A1R4H0S2_9GAMM|nr:hypothetical protein [Crenothrix polyspora]SJM89449.1 exported hypothetical protein [Crenothrix polyspora]